MNRRSEKLLTILLALVVGLLPLQRAMAGFASATVQETGVHQMAHEHYGNPIMAADHVTDQASTHISDHTSIQHCEQCDTDTGCNEHSCVSGHCVSCALLPLSVFPFTTSLAMTTLFQHDDSPVSQLSSYLFRPPRA